jgi:hypothetical protein
MQGPQWGRLAERSSGEQEITESFKLPAALVLVGLRVRVIYEARGVSSLKEHGEEFSPLSLSQFDSPTTFGKSPRLAHLLCSPSDLPAVGFDTARP